MSLRQFTNNPAKVLDELALQDLVLTERGRAVAALVYLDDEELEDAVLAQAETLWEEVEAARTEYEEIGGIGHEQITRRLKRRQR